MFTELFLIKDFWLQLSKDVRLKKKQENVLKLSRKPQSDEVDVHLEIKRDSLHEQF
jgi:preprotein translocase subunit Sss1